MRLAHLFLFRFLVLQAAVLTLLPLAALTFARDMLGNLFVLGPWGCFWVTLLGLWCGWANMTVGTLIYRYGPERCGLDPIGVSTWSRSVRRHRHALFGALGAGPMLLAVFWATKQGDVAPPLLRLGLSVVLGTAVALGLAYGAQLVRQFMVPPDTEHDNLLFPQDDRFQQYLHRFNIGLGDRLKPWRSRLARRLGSGFYDPEANDFRSGHLLALAVDVAVGLVYVLIGWLTHPARPPHSGLLLFDAFPALGYLLLLVLVMTMFLGVVPFFFDRWRVPSVLALLALSLVGYLIAPTDYVFETGNLPTMAWPTPAQAVATWQHDFADEPARLVVVAASGGGITAAAWTTAVLGGIESQLDDEVGRDFTRSLGAISAVSGGSVGTLFYLSGFERGIARSAEALATIGDAAAAPSLRPVAWGMAYPDVWRFLFSPLAWFWPTVDRARALELSWQHALHGVERRGMALASTADPCLERLGRAPAMSNETLHCFGQRIARGQVPVPLLNTTEVETGEAMVFVPLDLAAPAAPSAAPTTGNMAAAIHQPFAGVDNFVRRWQGVDVSMLTATRLSATFPWITPVARGPVLPDGQLLHLADGGYYDNAGMATLVEWLELVLEQGPDIREVLVIRIDAAEAEQNDDPTRLQHYGRRLLDGGWAAETFGPVRTLMQVRGATQGARNLRALDLLRDRWQRDTTPRTISVACFLRNDRGLPLSWRLTPKQQAQIEGDWAEGPQGRHSDAFDLVSRFLRGEVSVGETRCDRAPVRGGDGR